MSIQTAPAAASIPIAPAADACVMMSELDGKGDLALFRPWVRDALVFHSRKPVGAM